MEFTDQNGAHGQNGTAKATTKASQPEAKKDNGIPSKKDIGSTNLLPDKSTSDKEPLLEPKAEVPPAPIVPAPVEPEKPVPMPIKQALNLEGTLKVVDDLHRRSIQRINLLSRIKQLEAFEVSLTQEHDELDENPYQGCKLIIEDDKQRRFITTTPGLIRLVSQFIFNACNEKLGEIEALIVFPTA